MQSGIASPARPPSVPDPYPRVAFFMEISLSARCGPAKKLTTREANRRDRRVRNNGTKSHAKLRALPLRQVAQAGRPTSEPSAQAVELPVHSRMSFEATGYRHRATRLFRR